MNIKRDLDFSFCAYDSNADVDELYLFIERLWSSFCFSNLEEFNIKQQVNSINKLTIVAVMKKMIKKGLNNDLIAIGMDHYVRIILAKGR